MGLSYRLACLALLGSLGAPGCGAEGLDPNIDPVTEGDWYRPAVETTWQ